VYSRSIGRTARVDDEMPVVADADAVYCVRFAVVSIRRWD
jgi:hypothetical protein